MTIDLLENSPDKSVTLVLLSGMTDAAELVSKNTALVKEKVGRVVIMGGVEVENDEVKYDAHGHMTPDKAANNVFDFHAAEVLYSTLQLEGIPMTVVTRWTAYAAKLPLSIYDRMAKTGNPVGVRLQKAQVHSLEHLWKRCNMPDGVIEREGLPGRCDKKWFSKVFLNGKGLDRTGKDSIWKLTDTFQAYDPLAQLVGVPEIKMRFFEPKIVDVRTKKGVVCKHEIVGLSEKNHGVKTASDLAQFLSNAVVKGLKVTPSRKMKHARKTS